MEIIFRWKFLFLFLYVYVYASNSAVTIDVELIYFKAPDPHYARRGKP